MGNYDLSFKSGIAESKNMKYNKYLLINSLNGKGTMVLKV